MNAANEYLTVTEAAELLRVSVSTLRRWIRAGMLTAHRAGHRRLLLKRADVARVVRAVEPAASAASQAASPPTPRATRSISGRPTMPEHEEKSTAPVEAVVPTAGIEAEQQPLTIMAPQAWEDIREAREFRTEQLMGEYDPVFDQFDIGVLASMIVHSPDRPRRRRLTPDEQRRMLHALENAERTRERIRRRSGVDKFPPSEDIIAEMREERTRQLLGEDDAYGDPST